MDMKITAIVAVAILVVAGAGAYFLMGGDGGTDKEDERKTITVTDKRGVEVEVKTPVEKVLVTSHELLDVFAAVHGEGFEEKLVAYPGDLGRTEPTKDVLYKKHVPALKELDVLPDLFFGGPTFPDEQFAKYEPDVVFVSKATMDWMNFNEESYKLTKATGAAVIWLYSHNSILGDDEFRSSVDIVGKVLGKEDRATQIADRFENEIEKVTSVMPNVPADLKRKTIYYEFMMPEFAKGASPGMGLLEVDICEAKDLAEVPHEIIDQERISDVRDPDTNAFISAKVDHVILLATTSFLSEEAAIFGYGKKATDPGAQETLLNIQNAYLGRPGWAPQDFKAAEEHRIWLFFPTLRSSLLAFANVQYLAKMLYPEQFADLDVEANINEMQELFMPFPGDGLYMYRFTLPENT